jgi:thiol-disulfide isomerase/thioredoxin
MNKNVLLNLSVIFVLCGLLWCGSYFLARMDKPLWNEPLQERTLSDVKFVDIQGKKYYLSSFKGKTVLLHTWATWCSICVAEFPSLLNFVKQHKNIVLITFSVDAEQKTMVDFINKKLPSSETIIHVWDKDKNLTEKMWNIKGYPDTMIINDQLVLIDHIRGKIDWNHYHLPLTR